MRNQMPRYFALAFGSIFLVTIGHAANPPQPLVPVTVTAGFHHRGPKHPSGGAQATCIGVENQHNPFKDATELAVNPPKTLGHKGNLTSDVWTIGGEGASTVKIAEYYSARGPITVRLLDTTGNLLKEHVIPRDPPAGGGPADKRVGLNTILWDIGDPQQVSKTKVAKIIASAGIPQPPNAGNAGAYVILKLEFSCCDCQEWSASQQQCVTRLEYIPAKDVTPDHLYGGTDQVVPTELAQFINMMAQYFGAPTISPVQNAWWRTWSDYCCPQSAPSGCIGEQRFNKDRWTGQCTMSASLLNWDCGDLVEEIVGPYREYLTDILADQLKKWLTDTVLPSFTGAALNVNGTVDYEFIRVRIGCDPMPECKAGSVIQVGSMTAAVDQKLVHFECPFLAGFKITLLHAKGGISRSGQQINADNIISITTQTKLTTEWSWNDTSGSEVWLNQSPTTTTSTVKVCPHDVQ